MYISLKNKNAIFADMLTSLPLYLKSRAFPNEFKMLHLGRYCIPYFLLKVWYALETFQLNDIYTLTDER